MLGVVLVFLKSSSSSFVALCVSFLAGGGLGSFSAAGFSTLFGEHEEEGGAVCVCVCVCVQKRILT